MKQELEIQFLRYTFFVKYDPIDGLISFYLSHRNEIFWAISRAIFTNKKFIRVFGSFPHVEYFVRWNIQKVN